jgi:predicted ATPase
MKEQEGAYIYFTQQLVVTVHSRVILAQPFWASLAAIRTKGFSRLMVRLTSEIRAQPQFGQKYILG